MERSRWIARGLLLVALILFLAAVGARVYANTVRPLGIEEMAAYGATHVMTVDYDDLSAGDDGGGETVEVATVAANVGVEVVALVVKVPFTDSATSSPLTNCSVTVGDGTAENKYVAPIETCTNNTASFARFAWGTGTQKVYTAADTIDVVFSPDTNAGLDELDAGQLQVFLRIIDAR